MYRLVSTGGIASGIFKYDLGASRVFLGTIRISALHRLYRRYIRVKTPLHRRRYSG